MAPPKKTTKPAKKPHKYKPLGLRFPDRLVAAMRELAKKNRRPLTTEFEIAMENHLLAAGLWPPDGKSSD